MNPVCQESSQRVSQRVSILFKPLLGAHNNRATHAPWRPNRALPARGDRHSVGRCHARAARARRARLGLTTLAGLVLGLAGKKAGCRYQVCVFESLKVKEKRERQRVPQRGINSIYYKLYEKHAHARSNRGSKPVGLREGDSPEPSFGRRPDRHEASRVRADRDPCTASRTQARPDSARGSSRAVGWP